MPFRGTGAYETHITPQDQDVVQTQQRFIGLSRTSLRFSIYGATLRSFFDTVISQDQAGVNCKGLFDHTESTTPAEHSEILRFYSMVRNPSNYLIGTSPQAHQILHFKGIWTNHSRDVPFTGSPMQFETWEEAAAAGYPCTWSGSWNFSASASKQFNNVDILPGFDRAKAIDDAFNTIFDWVAANEPQYQVAKAA